MEIWAHRGAHDWKIPENTIPAFDAAYDAGAYGIELDVRMCGSGEPIVFHDAGVFRKTATGRSYANRIEDLSFRELKEVRLYGKYAIPPLDMVLANYGHEIPLILDIKSDKVLDHRLEHSVLKLLDKYGLTEKTIISSDNPLSLLAFRALSEDCRLAWVMHKMVKIPIWRWLPIEAVHAKLNLFGEKTAAKIRKAGKDIRIWTPNDYRGLITAKRLGAVGVITDKPAHLIKKESYP